LYSHQQWRSPSASAGVGVAYIHTPIPLSTDMLVWFAKNEYAKRQASGDKSGATTRPADIGGRLIGEWTDSLGRHWFEAESTKYHVKGYAMTRGCEAWIVYSGWRVKSKPCEAEIALGARAADSVVPLSPPNVVAIPNQATALRSR
jgi:hypothetical protein